MKMICASLLMFISLNAQAMTEKQFTDKLYAAIEAKQTVVEDMDLKTLKAKQLANLYKAANELSGIWGDTILEGDFALDPKGEIEIVWLEKVSNTHGDLLAYNFTYRHRAYSTSECEIDWDAIENNTESYEDQLVSKECGHGYIVGKAYISPDFKHFMRDEDNIEDYSGDND
jgi:hypothetical protein